MLHCAVRSVSPGQFVTVNQDRHTIFFFIDARLGLKPRMDLPVNVKAAFVVRGDNKRVLRRTEIIGCDRLKARLFVGNLVDPPLVVEGFQRRFNVASCEGLDCGLEFGVFRTDDFFKVSRPHSGPLKLLEWLAGVNGLVLADVTNK